jgi:hypothetical protein
MTERTRDEHLQWCKDRALEILRTGDIAMAVASMLSDLTKWREPLYSQATLNTLSLAGMMFCKTPAEAKRWIEGFN